MTVPAFMQRYSLQSGLHAHDLVCEIDSIWDELRRPSSALRVEAKQRNIELADNLPERAPITVTQDGSGFDPSTVAVIVALAPVVAPWSKLTAKVLEDLWVHIFLPMILQRRGERALTVAAKRDD